jgi:hypothetical protein
MTQAIPEWCDLVDFRANHIRCNQRGALHGSSGVSPPSALKQTPPLSRAAALCGVRNTDEGAARRPTMPVAPAMMAE